MPLIKSKSDKAFKKNVATEVKAGKPVKQAVAIAYNTKRTAKKAAGGSLDPMNYDSDVDYYEARQKAGLPARPRGYTDAERNAIISGSIYKKQPYKAPVVPKRDPEKERSAMESIEKSLAKMREIKEANKKMRAERGYKSGGQAKKTGGCW
jgi:hypothetical protein